MHRVLKPSAKAISVSQTCCFPTEPTCQCGDLQPQGKHTHTCTDTHENTRPRTNTLSHTQTSKRTCSQVQPNTHPHVFVEKSARMQRHRQNKYWHGHMSGNLKKKKKKVLLFTLPRIHTNTWLVRRFTPVWKDKHQLINKSVSPETC